MEVTIALQKMLLYWTEYVTECVSMHNCKRIMYRFKPVLFDCRAGRDVTLADVLHFSVELISLLLPGLQPHHRFNLLIWISCRNPLLVIKA